MNGFPISISPSVVTETSKKDNKIINYYESKKQFKFLYEPATLSFGTIFFSIVSYAYHPAAARNNAPTPRVIQVPVFPNCCDLASSL